MRTCVKPIKFRRGCYFDMLIQRTSQFELAKILTLVYISLACVSLPLADSDDHSATLANSSGSARRTPDLSFKIIERRSHDGLPMERHTVSHRRSNHHHGVNKHKNYDMQQTPVSYRRAMPYKPLDSNKNRKKTKNFNVNVNTNSGADFAYKDDIPFSLLDDRNTGLADNFLTITNLETKLHCSVIFRFNMIAVFGQILRAPNINLTTDQFISLNLLRQALIQKQVYVFNLLPLLHKLQTTDKENQFQLVMQALGNNVPVYMKSVSDFWLNEIEKQHVDVKKIMDSIGKSTDFLIRIDPEAIEISKVGIAAEELEPFDKVSKLINQTIGPVFVNIFSKLKNREITLSQKLFGAILINLPTGKLNPVLEEYLNYIWDETQGQGIPNWNGIATEIEYGSPYELVNSVVKKLLSREDTPDVLKRALKYILLHLKEVPSNYSDEYYTDMQILMNNEVNLEQMFIMIPDDLTIPELGHLKDEMIFHINDINIDGILKGMNNHTYEKPFDALIALLTRIQSRTQNETIRDTVTKLLSILILKKQLESFSVLVPADIDLGILLDLLHGSDSDPMIPTIVKQIQQYLEGDLDLLNNLQNFVSKQEKSKCYHPVQCLPQVLTDIVEPNTAQQLGVPSTLITIIQTLINLITIANINVVKCDPHNIIPIERPQIPDSINNVVSKPITQTSESTSQSVPHESLGSTGKPTFWSIPPLISIDYKEPIFKPDHPNRSEEILKPHVIPTVTPIISTVPPTLSSEEPPVSTIIPIGFLPTWKPPPTSQPNILLSQADDEPILPPMLKYDKPIYVVFPNDDTPPYMLPNRPDDTQDTGTVIEYPSIQQLLQGFDLNTPFKPEELPNIAGIFVFLRQTLGPNFIEEILGKRVDKTKYPTVVSLIDDVLDQALEHPKVKASPELVLSIQQCLKGIDYISVAALFPMIIHSQSISSDVLYVTFNPDDLNTNLVNSEPLQSVPAGFMTLTIYHPKYSMQLVDPADPYGTLLPSLDKGEVNPIQELIRDGSLQEILGPNFNPLLYPNRGILLITILQKLIVSKRVQTNLPLLKLLDLYLKSIRSVTLYNKLPNDYDIHLIKVQQNDVVNWQPDTVSLIVALPPAQTQVQWNQINLIKSFLKTSNLLKLLDIVNPPYTITRGILLRIIFNAAIRGKKMNLDDKTMAALRYYESKILSKGHGALPIIWVWLRTFIIRTEIPLGEIIESVIDFDNLPSKLKISYNDLVTYLSKNPQFLQGDDSFAFEKYNTKGTFLRGLFAHFLTEPDVSSWAKKDLKLIIPHINLTGHGAEPMNHVTITDITNGKIDKDTLSVVLKG